MLTSNAGDAPHLHCHELSSPELALGAYTAVRTANRMVLQLEWRGAPGKIVYQVE